MNKTIMIIEGIDRVGKTTLINKLKAYYSTFEEMDISVIKASFNCSNPTEKVFQEKIYTTLCMFRDLEKCISNDSLILMDRFYMTEEVYGLVDRGYQTKVSDLSEIMLSKLDMNVITIYVEPVNLLESEKKHGTKLSNHLKIFENVLKLTKLKTVRTNYDEINNDFENLIERIYDELQ